MPPLQEPILSFLHTFSLKIAHVRGQPLPQMGPRPPENPGSGPACGTVAPSIGVCGKVAGCKDVLLIC